MKISIPVKQEPSLHYGQVNEHSEYGGIFQVVFKPTPQTVVVLPVLEVV